MASGIISSALIYMHLAYLGSIHIVTAGYYNGYCIGYVYEMTVSVHIAVGHFRSDSLLMQSEVLGIICYWQGLLDCCCCLITLSYCVTYPLFTLSLYSPCFSALYSLTPCMNITIANCLSLVDLVFYLDLFLNDCVSWRFTYLL
jgi:hypothetical protein